MEFDMTKIKRVNPIAKALLSIRKQVVPSKKGKGSYNRKKENTIAKQVQWTNVWEDICQENNQEAEARWLEERTQITTQTKEC